MEEVVAKRKVCHKAWRNSKSAEGKHTLDVDKKEIYTAVLAVQESTLQELMSGMLYLMLIVRRIYGGSIWRSF